MATKPDSHLPAPPTVKGLREDLSRALADSQFFLLYQPTIDLQSGAFVGVEALLRWRHPARGIVSPEAFLPELESSGLILSVGAWVIDAACHQGAEWHSSGNRFTVSVNLSPRQLDDEGLVGVVERALSDSTFDAAHLVLECSEHTLATLSALGTARLVALRDLGVRIAIDDFGTEASSRAVLTEFPIDIVKIDRTFIRGVATSAEAASRVHDVVQLGKSLNVQTIAQGIEDDDQRLRLQFEDVDVGQGFLFSIPHDASDINRYLEDFAIFSGKPL